MLTLIYLCSLTPERDYFSTNIIGQTFVSSIIPRKRFIQIKACVLVANPTPEQNAEEKLAKTWPILKMV